MAIWAAIHPTMRHTRVLATARRKQTLLKAHLSLSPRHVRAVPTLLEALALWQGEQVRAALVAERGSATCDTNLFRDCLDYASGSPFYQLEVVEHRRRTRRDEEIRGMGDFRDLRQLLLWEVAR